MSDVVSQLVEKPIIVSTPIPVVNVVATQIDPVDLDFEKEVEILGAIRDVAKKFKLSFADAKVKHQHEVAKAKEQSDLRARKSAADFYARQKR